MLGIPITIKRQQGEGERKWATTELWITRLEIIKIICTILTHAVVLTCRFHINNNNKLFLILAFSLYPVSVQGQSSTEINKRQGLTAFSYRPSPPNEGES